MDDPEQQPRLRGAARDEAIRAGIEPLAPGERPTAVTVAAALCAGLGSVNLLLWATGIGVDRRPSVAVVGIFALVAFSAAAGLWQVRYGAVIGFQAVLAGTVIVSSLSVLVAANALAIVLCAAVILLGGWLFWKLVRVLARMQAPPPGA